MFWGYSGSRKLKLLISCCALLFGWVVSIFEADAQEVGLGCFVAMPEQGGASSIPKDKTCVENDIWLANGESEGFTLVVNGLTHNYRLEIQPTNPETPLQFSVYRVSPVYYRDSLGVKNATMDRLEPLSLSKDINPLAATELLWIRINSGSSTKPDTDVLKIILRTNDKIYSTQVKVRCVDLDLVHSPEMYLQASIASTKKMCNANADEIVLHMAEFLKQWNINALSGAVGAENLANTDQTYRELFDKIGIKRVRIAFLNMKKIDKNDEAIRVGDKNDRWTQMSLRSISVNRQLAREYGNKLQVKVWDEPRADNFEMLKRGYEFVKKNSPETLTELTAPPRPELYGSVDIFIPRIQDIRANDVKAARDVGKDVYFYANSMHSIRRPLRTLRNIGWLTYSLGANGYHIWCVNCWNGDLADGVIGEQSFFGRGAFIYPTGKCDDYYPSLRLEMIKDATEDYRIFHAIKKHPLALQVLSSALEGQYRFKEGEKSYDSDARALHDRVLRAIVELGDKN